MRSISADQPSLPDPPLLEVDGLGIAFRSTAGWLDIVNDVSFTVRAGEAVGLVGESGSGKTVTGLSILRLLPPAVRLTGQIRFEGRNLLDLAEEPMRRLRGRRIGMIFQEPMTALDPVFTVGEQIAESLRLHLGLSRRQAAQRAIDALAEVGIPAPARRAEDYPHQLSGGMRQRVMIAIALACEPSLLIADEPTTALDVTIQAQIIELLLALIHSRGASMIFISHDIDVVRHSCSRMITLYAGQIVEDGPVEPVLQRPRHPYTSGLLRSLPRQARHKALLPSIGGRVPTPDAMPPGCRFQPRCGHGQAACAAPQTLEDAGPARRARCCRQQQLDLPGLGA